MQVQDLPNAVFYSNVVKIPTPCKSVIGRNILHICGTVPTDSGCGTSTQGG
jgi:hypothetical protein